jgi:hypothetical protein
MEPIRMTPENKFIISTQAMSRKVGEETVILDLGSGNYFGLDPVGSRFWQLIEDGQTFAQLCDTIAEEYDVTREQLEEDLSALARQLAERRLIAGCNS